MQSKPYIAFPTEVVSNTYDFDVRWVIHSNRKMRGVFARRAINEGECGLFIGVYPGLMKTKQESQRKVAQYAERHSMEKQAAAGRVNAYSLWHRYYDSEHVLDPTDEVGKLLPEFALYMALYINEPPPGCMPNAVFVHNRPRKRCEVWLIHAVGQDQEILHYYGKGYIRDYPINMQAVDGRHSFYIGEESSFEADRRATPKPLRLPS